MKTLCQQVVRRMSMSQREERLATTWALLSQVAARAMDFDMRCLGWDQAAGIVQEASTTLMEAAR
eukprot:10224325-Prorocentrum_lima.AAC.1